MRECVYVCVYVDVLCVCAVCTLYGVRICVLLFLSLSLSTPLAPTKSAFKNTSQDTVREKPHKKKFTVCLFDIVY